VAILNINSGVYYGLDLVGTHVWNLLQKPQSVSAISEVVLREYDVEPERCLRDVIDLLEKLLAEGLIDVKDGSTTSALTRPCGDSRPTSPRQGS
jgi:hypothetical protein